VAVYRYKHLGSVTLASGGIGPCVQCAKGNAAPACCPIAASVFGNPHFGAHRDQLLWRSAPRSRALLSKLVVTAIAMYITVPDQPCACAQRRWCSAKHAGGHFAPLDRVACVHTRLMAVGRILVRRSPSHVVRLLVNGPPPPRAPRYASM